MDKQQVLDNLITGVVVVDAALNVAYLNTAAESLLGVSRVKSQGQGLDCLFGERPGLGRFVETLATGQGFIDADCDLGQVHVELAVSVLESDARYLIIELTPIDQLKRLSQDAFHQVQQQASQEILRGLAHEIKNPLGGLRGAAQLLALELTAAQREYTDLILAQVDRLTALVDRLLGPKTGPQRSLVNIHQVLERVRTLVSLQAPEGIRILRDYDPSLPDMALDPGQIEQALLNVVQNAVQALGSQGQVVLRSRVASGVTLQGSRHRMVARIDIEDDGPGVPDKLKDTLFYPLVTGRADGSGMGLAIAQSLVALHGGRIELDSKPGRTLFTLFLPMEDSQ
ncbi:nitrogen regulation protein NR(II) [Gallaecimonas xiamenensis]|uniref:Sensory histidine kinase/phosphatase NtrB n=1 Tax=Gallaecimonas xiamenensis 3-C-1 TaxID=745411 RepID=K2JRK4_9GAMM|nr:nitrogen regulation protein NR(II) [Gallaecimonas xiamenensis]EKE73054.1 nitrogen regulation protein NR(II) [Gallaecimonas xiamenensis 3-C-1]